MQWPIDRLEGGQSEKGQRHRSYLSPDLSQKIGRRKTLFRFFFLFFFPSPSSPPPRDLYEQKKRFSCSLVTREHMRVFVARWQAAVNPWDRLVFLSRIRLSPSYVSRRKEKKGKNLVAFGFGMTSWWPSSKKEYNLLVSDSFPRLFVQVRVTLELFCHLPPPVETYPTQQPPRYFCSSVSCSV